jgi:NAD(P)-dependent dehydrogenase (short-subunit alcohol dehydrogenase family)
LHRATGVDFDVAVASKQEGNAVAEELDPKSERVVAVTGAGTGIGQAIAAKFGALAWRVAVGGRRVDKLGETAPLVEEAGGTCLPHELDVTDGESVERFFDDVESEFGTVTAVINNAAMARYGPLDDFSPAEIEAEIATKLTGSLLMARRGIQAMRRDGRGGDILFITSLAAATPWPFHLPYAAASAGVEHAVRTLRLELEGSGIRVLNLRCGETAGTDFATREMQSGRALPANQEWFRMNLLRHTGLMVPDDVADAVVAAVTLPRGHQYSVMEVTPAAPIGPLPATFEEWGIGVAEKLAPQ